MGDVYEAEQVILKKRVAIKTLKSHLMETSAFVRFQNEAQAASRLNHPNIIGVYDCGISLSGEPYMIMELVQGTTLARHLKQNGPLSIDESIAISSQICAGVICAHAAGILHRDLKPSNVILADDGGLESRPVARILDFGIAKILDTEVPGAQLTRTGELFGTPSYMSPEQCNGLKVDQRADVYSVGCILYEMLTGDPPITGKTAMETMLKQTTEIPLPLRQAAMRHYPAALETIVATALAKDPDARYDSMSDMLLAIQNFKKGVATKPPKQKTKGGGINLRNAGLIGGGTALIATVVLSILSFDDNVKSTIEKPPPPAQRNDTPPAPSVTKTEIAHEPDPATEQITRKELSDFFRRNSRQQVLRVPSDKTQVLVDDDLAPLKGDVNITHLELRGCPHLTAKGLEYLTSMPNLNWLELPDTLIDDSAVPVLKKMHLRILNLARTKITSQGITALAQNCELLGLGLERTELSTKALGTIAKDHNLRDLILDQCSGVTDEGIAALSKSKVTDLALMETEITDKCVQSLVPMPLLYLGLKGTNITGAGLRELAKLKTLRCVKIGNCTHLGKDDVAYFRKALPNCEIKD